ncbi:MAG: hypothetical protein EHM59_20490 [Betaproteobacteria bacterium]|nr:MAG: hypothetical protein EHM59_20490 [Betaproteobacteria bacterium]
MRAALALLLGVVLVWTAPLIGLVLAGEPIASYLRFPPLTESVAHAPFLWPVFGLYASLLALVGVMLWVGSTGRRAVRQPGPPLHRFPWWGMLGLGLIACGWIFAWSDTLVPVEVRRHTFAVLWLGYILAMNGLVHRRIGACLLTHRTRWLLALFPVSAGFWWLFEHLNQFVDNWYYDGIEDDSRWAYFLQATVPFSTVLPAVASTSAWLGSHARLDFAGLPSVRAQPAAAWLALLTGTLALAGVGLWPEALFALLWLGPLLLFCALQYLLLGETFLAPLAHGDWRPLLQPALAGLLCGLVWELWNYGSAAQWHYSIPYVQRFHVFEMPLAGYGGYVPFGILCVVVADLVAKVVEGRDRLAP